MLFCPVLEASIAVTSDGNMAGERNRILLRLVSDCEIVPSRNFDDLDEVGAAFLKAVNRSSRFFRCADAKNGGVNWFRWIGTGSPRRKKHRTGGDDLWADERAILDFAAPAFESVEIPAHVADSSDAVRDKERQQRLLRPCRIRTDARDVGVHIPKPGNQEFSASIDPLRVFRYLNRTTLGDHRDRIAFDDDGLIRKLRAAVDSDHGYVINCERFRLLRIRRRTRGLRRATARR